MAEENSFLGLLADGGLNDTLMNVGAGLLSVAGPSLQPRSFGEGLTLGLQNARQSQQQRLRNEALREEMRQKKRQREARQELLTRMNQPTPTQEVGEGLGVFSPDGLQQRQQAASLSSPESMGLLMEAFPETAGTLLTDSFRPNELQQEVGQIESLLGRPLSEQELLAATGIDSQQRAEPKEARIARILADPNESPEVKNNIRAQLEEEGNSQLIQTIEAQKAMLDLERTRNELAQENRSQAQQKQAVADNFVNTVDRADKLLSANDKLEGTFLEAGKVMPEERGALFTLKGELEGAFGKDSSKTRELVSAQNTFQKNASGFAIDLIANIENATNQKFEVLRNSIANLGVDPETNRQIIGDVIQQSLQVIRRNNVDVPDRAMSRAESLLERIQGGGSNRNQSGGSGGGDSGGGRFRYNPITGELEPK